MEEVLPSQRKRAAAYVRELEPNQYLEAAERLHDHKDSTAIFATAFRLMLEKTFLQRFQYNDYPYFYTSLAGLTTFYLLKKGPLDGYDRSFLSRLPWRSAAVLFNKNGKLLADRARDLFYRYDDIIVGAEDALKDGCAPERVSILQDVLRANITSVRRIDSDMVMTPPPLFRDRKPDATGKLLNAYEFFLAHWSWRVLLGEVYSDDLKDADPQLYMALAQHQHRRLKRLSDLIPASPTKGRKPHIRTETDRLEEKRRAAAVRMQRHRNASRAKQANPDG